MSKFKKSEMLYDDYVWSAEVNGDNPFVKNGKEAKELNRKEGWEVLYFINNSFRWPETADKSDYQKVEKMIRLSVPKETHDMIGKKLSSGLLTISNISDIAKIIVNY